MHTYTAASGPTSPPSPRRPLVCCWTVVPVLWWVHHCQDGLAGRPFLGLLRYHATTHPLHQPLPHPISSHLMIHQPSIRLLKIPSFARPSPSFTRLLLPSPLSLSLSQATVSNVLVARPQTPILTSASIVTVMWRANP